MALSAHARQVALTGDGLLVSICTDGTVWFYSPSHQEWLCLVTGTVELTQVVFDASETTAFVLDVDGHLMSIDLALVRQSLNPSNLNK